MGHWCLNLLRSPRLLISILHIEDSEFPSEINLAPDLSMSQTVKILQASGVSAKTSEDASMECI